MHRSTQEDYKEFFCIFLSFIQFIMNFGILNELHGILNQKKILEIEKCCTVVGQLRPKATTHGCGGLPCTTGRKGQMELGLTGPVRCQAAWPTRPHNMARARSRCSHCVWSGRSSATTGGERVASVCLLRWPKHCGGMGEASGKLTMTRSHRGAGTTRGLHI
jgi:hypothetical protein